MKNPILCGAALIFLAACSQQKTSPPPQPISEQQLAERGQYLVSIAGCNDCHSPKVMTPNGPEPDRSRLLSGHPQEAKLPPIQGNTGWLLFAPDLTAAVGPWGTSYAANLTPDDTGTGNWTLEQFKNALRHGKFKGLEGGRSLLPPMPWQNYKNMTDEDVHAIFTYLRSIPKVSNLVPTPEPPRQ